MITKMKKMTFLVYRNSYVDFLEKLRSLGVLHVNDVGDVNQEDEEMQTKMSELSRYDQTICQLKDMNVGSDTEVQIDINTPSELLDRIDYLNATVASINQKLNQIAKDIAVFEPWGDFDPKSLDKLCRSGYQIRLYSCMEKSWKAEWEERYHAIKVGTDSLRIYFVTVTSSGELPDIDADSMRMPECSLSEMKRQSEKLNADSNSAKAEIDRIAVYGIPLLEKGKEEVLQNIDYFKVLRNTDKEAEGRICVLQGWLPAADIDRVLSSLDDKGLYIKVDDPTPDDKDIPILLKNNKFVKLFEPFTKLYMLPGYRELDLTLFIAPFFMLFFGLCFGDIGYGLLMLLALPLFRKLFHLIDPRFSDGIIILLGLSTILCGFLTGGFFGFNIYNINIPFVQRLKDVLYQDQMKLLYLAFIIGGVHIVVSMILKSVNMAIQFGFRYAVSTIGWVIMIISSTAAYFMPGFGFDSILYSVLASIAGFSIFLFNCPDKNPFFSIKNLLLNIGSGLWDTYNMATGLLGDVLSYVRLFALGMSGSVLASVFDDLAVGVFNTDSFAKGVFTFIGCALIFLFGHAINIFMNFLSSMIHPMRLIFVEFFKNTAYAGGGDEYHPFK
jgi:V/A-type H+/Na+-transporting ATPase subunit I